MKLTLLTVAFVAASLAGGICLAAQSPWGFAVLPIVGVLGNFWATAQDLGCDD
jgi:hypothetical protein